MQPLIPGANTVLFLSLLQQQYNFLSSPVPFECPDTILSPALSSSTPHTVRLEASSRVFTPIPFQPRVSTPYPVVDSVASGKGNFCQDGQLTQQQVFQHFN